MYMRICPHPHTTLDDLYSHTNIHIRTHTHTFVYIYAYIPMYIYIYIYMYIYIQTNNHMYNYIHIRIYICIYDWRGWKRLSAQGFRNATLPLSYVHIYIQIGTYEYIYTRIYICIGGAKKALSAVDLRILPLSLSHTHTQTHTHTTGGLQMRQCASALSRFVSRMSLAYALSLAYTPSAMS